jgi:hypothetical protein
MRFAQQFRQVALGCFNTCGGEIKYPFRAYQISLMGKNNVCFSDCMNIQFENHGPRLSDMGEVPADSIPVKFVWAESQ